MVNASLAYNLKVLQHPLLTMHKNVEWNKTVDEWENHPMNGKIGCRIARRSLPVQGEMSDIALFGIIVHIDHIPVIPRR